MSRLYDEVLELRGETSNFASLLRCACVIHATRGEARTPWTLAAE